MSNERKKIISEVIETELNLTDYVDLIDFLSRLYDVLKNSFKFYSYTFYSEDLGLGKGNSIWLILNGKRKITRKSYDRIRGSIKLSKLHGKYLDLMFDFYQEKEFAQKDIISEKMLEISRKLLPEGQSKMTLDFYSEWYHPIIFEMIDLDSFESDPKWIANKLNRYISIDQARESLKLLESIKMIKFDKRKKRYIKLKKNFESPNSVPGLGVIQYHKQMIDLAKQSIDDASPHKREIGAFTATVTEEGMNVIRDEIRSMRRYLSYLMSEHEGGDQILQLNFQLFPIVDQDD